VTMVVGSVAIYQSRQTESHNLFKQCLNNSLISIFNLKNRRGRDLRNRGSNQPRDHPESACS
jgi:hypothetical protein